MQTQETLDLDYFQEDATAPVVPRPPVLSSYESGWENIQLAYHRQPSWEIPEVCGSQHIIVLPGSKCPVNVEFVSEGCLQHIQYYPHHYANASIEIFPANLPYRVSWDEEVEFIHCYLDPAFLNSVAHETVDPDRVELVLELMKVDQLLHQLALRLKAELENGVSDRLYIDAIATFLSAHLLRHYTSRKQVLRPYEDGLPNHKLKQALEYINDHLSEQVSLKAIAEELKMSKYYFCRLFKQSVGMAPHQYLNQQRVERAKYLLKCSHLSVTNVALECGFANQSHMAKFFRRYIGMSPQQFRKQ